MSRIQDVEWESCLLEPRVHPEFERRYRKETGRPDLAVRYFVGSDWVCELVMALAVQVETRVALAADLSDMAGLVVSQDNSCRYCFATMRTFLRLLGMPERRIEQLEEDLLTGEFSASERVALDFARRVSRSNPLPTSDDVAALRKHGYEELAITELCGAVALHVFFNRLATLVALPPQTMERFPDRWYVRLARPLMALRVRSVRRSAPHVPLTPEQRTGPFSPLVCALDGLPLAAVLRRSIDEMLDAPALPRRTKALVLAVIARALQCPLSEGEAVRLAADGGLGADDVEAVLAHLHHPALDPVERVAVPFARETVWYRPAAIQRRAREVMDALSREQFIELVGVTALGNALCRLGVATLARG